MKVLEKKLVVEEVEQVLDPECANIEYSYIPSPTSMVPTFDNLTEYLFETENVALKNYTDYYKLLRTLSILEGQRNLVVSTLEKLSELLENSQKNPLEQVDLLKKGEFFSPPRVEITELPVVDWFKYGVNVPEFILKAKPTFSQNSQNDTQIKIITGKMVVRGRIFDESKPVTFNQH
ncbi:ZZ-type zinc finger-containing protein 3-like [Artemia franciscana]|uniref:ZZ-type zinc finger-containing protein 3-like n=1 Tax=Artemia franciscana TaxID=6661 RepID=UPI0032D9B313